jgi:DNA mismatch endonuclease (patch repair protein)
MLSNRAKNTRPELLVRSALHSMGFRFRLHGRGLPGTPDVVFPRRRKAVWVHGCFWHSHQGCRYATVPKTRTDYWVPKLVRNRGRDAEHAGRLGELGWDTLVVWECELKDMEAVRGRLRNFLGSPRL